MINFLTNNLRTLFLFVVLLISLNITAQSLSPEYIRNVRVNTLNDSEIKQIKNEMDKQNMSFSTLENLAITNGMSATDFSVLKTRIESLSPEVNATNVEKGETIDEKPIELDAKSSIIKSDIFGSEIFNSTTLSFEPNANMATPANYILGAGDELQIVVYGMQEFAASAVVSKEGRITIPIVGQVFVNGLTFEAARVQIKKACGRIYSSLNSGQSSLSVSLSKIRTIKITIIGAKKSGNYSVSSLSTVFNALHVAGGPDANGSYRNIELLRNNKIIRKIDIYKFLAFGDQSDNINLLENDVIRIPVYENRVKIEGKVKRPGIFELLPNESFNDLLKYCSGFDESAYKANIKLIQNTDKELKIVDLTENDYKNYKPNSGDVFKVSELLGRFSNKVSIKGSVFRPDDYAFSEGMTVDDLIKKADGLKEDAYKNNVLLIREKADLTKEILNLNVNSTSPVALRKNDELVISSIFDLKNQHHVTVTGYIKNPGEVPFIENLTLYDLILLSGGFTEGASKVIEIARPIIKDEKIKDQKENSIIIPVEIDILLQDQTKNVFLQPFDIIQIRKKPVFETQKTISIAGQVLFPGDYTISNNNEKVLDMIERTGGLKTDANTKAIFIIRNGKKIPINYEYIKKHASANRNIIMKAGDQLFVNKLDNTVSVSGNVYLNTEVPYVSGKSVKYYLSAVGGCNENSDRNKIYVVKANGLAKSTKHFFFFRNYPKLEPGSNVFVPVYVEKIRKNKMTTAELSILSSAIGSLTVTILAIINLTK